MGALAVNSKKCFSCKLLWRPKPATPRKAVPPVLLLFFQIQATIRKEGSRDVFEIRTYKI